MKTLREQFYSFIDKAEFAAFFVFAERHLQASTELSTFKQEFIAGKYPVDFAQRLRTFIQNGVPETQAGERAKRFDTFLTKEVPVINDYQRLNERTDNNQTLDTSQVLDDKTSAHLDKNALKSFLAKERTKIFLQGLSKQATQQEKLRELSLADNGHIYKGTLLALGATHEVDKLSHTAVEACFARFRGTVRREAIPLQTEILRGNILKQYEEMMDLLHLHIPLVRRRDLDRDIYELPIEALRELVANAFVHRAYTKDIERTVQVELFDDRIEIINPINRDEIIDLENIQASIRRNPKIMQVFYLMGFVEKQGTGLNKVHLLLKEANLPALHIDKSEAGIVKMVVYRPKTEGESGADTHKHNIKNDLPKFLTYFYPNDFFIGREEDMQTLLAYLQSGKHALLLNGLGGIGKTALAREYVHRYQTNYAHIVWLQQSGDLLSTLLQRDLLENLAISPQQHENMWDVFLKVLDALKDLQGANLLVVDNCEGAGNKETLEVLRCLFALPAHWDILLTSREAVLDAKGVLLLDVLPEDKAIDLFVEHAKQKPCDRLEVHALLKRAGFHTLMTELWAKTYNESIDFESVAEFAQALAKYGLAYQDIQENISIKQQETRLYAHLRDTFSVAKLEETEVWLLKLWAVLPTAPHKAKDFFVWIGDEARTYKEPLKNLLRKGWLQTKDNIAYYMHPTLQIVLLEDLKPTYKDCAHLLDFFRNALPTEKVWANPLAHEWLMPIGEALLQHIDFDGYPLGKADLLDNLCFVYRELGNYSKALPYGEETARIRKEALGEEHINYLRSLHDLATLHHNLGNYVEALFLYRKVVEKEKKILGEEHPDYLWSLNNLGILYTSMGNYAEALPLYQEILQKYKNVLGELHPDYLVSLNNLGLFYSFMGDYAKALPLYEEALQKRKKILGEQHPDYANSLYNLGVLYTQQDEYQKALPYFEEAYKIHLETLGEEHPHTKKTKEMLDTTKAKL